MPDWVFQMELAETWGMKPWEVDDIPLIWVARAQEYYNLRAKLKKGY